ncbi:MAG TPA: hypothetical protein VMW52_13295 [Phycisphaerae bacterium]|nr:hypothetical protein [Phycisphaerae bacterium]
MALSDLTATLNDRFFFSLDYFAQVASYDPAGAGAARNVTVIVAEVEPETVDEEYVERSRERVWVTVRRDPDHAGGGIATPAIDDTLVLRGETTAPYSFQNEIRNRTADRWTLLFARDRPEAYRPQAT